ncbi:hypothetical protein OF846_005384 [Rhodotorula toruloides]|nr:hypothetical protein OF846_005384 [Rhodotorula toruloides]
MAHKTPATAALLAQSLGPDLAPLVGERSVSATPEPAASSTGAEGAVTAEQAVAQQAPILSSHSIPSSWFETVFGQLGSYRRQVSFHALALVVATVVRSLCFTRPVFGGYLLEELAPVEREGVRWAWIVGTRAAEIALGQWAWRRVRGLVKTDGAFFGVLFALVSRISLYTFEHHYFLLSAQTVFVLLLIDLISFAAAFSLLPYFSPPNPSARPVLSALTRLRQNPELWINVFLGIAIATFGAGVASFVLERVGGHAWVESGTREGKVPSYLLSDQLTTGEILSHPTWTVPTLRTYSHHPSSLPYHLLHSLLLTLPLLPLLSSLPSLSPSRLAALVFTATAIPGTVLLWDVLPVSGVTALGVGVWMGVRNASVAAGLGWVCEELRRVKVTRPITMVLQDPLTNEILATTTAVLELDARGQMKKDKEGVTERRRVRVRGEVEL